jgi:predicted nucleic acid-binding protein
MFLLDTNVISELRKPRPHGAVLAWYLSIPLASKAFPSVAYYELQAGVEITRKQNPHKALELELWIQEIAKETSILPLDYSAACETARLMAGKPRLLLEDAMIAAIARVNGYTVATRNVKDFRSFDVPLVNPFDYKA